MDWRWIAFLLVAGCFSDPPAGGSEGSTGEASTSTTSQTSSSTGLGDESSSSGSTTGFIATGSTSTGFDASTTEAPGCSGDAMCIMPPPPSWNGPVLGRVAQPGTPQPDCPPGSEEIWRGGRDPSAACDCTACSDDGVQCDAVVGFGANGSCAGLIEGTGCQPLVTMATGQLWLSLDIIPAADAACTPPMPETPRFGQHGVLCDPLGEACEDGGTCIAGPVCVWQEGEVECPQPFSSRTVLYEAFESKGLACDTCECGADAFHCEEATISLYAEALCGGEPTANPAVYETSSCAAYEDMNFVVIDDVVSIDIAPAPFECASSMDSTAASGEFNVIGARTLCCTP